ncbi:hypothetical protein H1R20_g1334, partial [Candolleomyces eurysporus]
MRCITGSLGCSNKHSTDNRYYHGLITKLEGHHQTHKEMLKQIVQLTQLKKKVEEEIDQATAHLKRAHQQGTSAEERVNHEIQGTRQAICTHQLKICGIVKHYINNNNNKGIYIPNKQKNTAKPYRCPFCKKENPGHLVLACRSNPSLINSSATNFILPLVKKTKSVSTERGSPPPTYHQGSKCPITKTLKETKWDPVKQAFVWPEE